MRVGMRLRPSLCHIQRPELSLRLSSAQRAEIRIELRLALIQELRGERYTPKGDCPACQRRLTPAEIMGGFNQDPRDFTTSCPGCGHRFEPVLVCFGNGTRVELPFYCGVQVLAQLPGKEEIGPERLAREHPAIYRSAIVHHGGIRRAFREIGIRYPFEEISSWENKAMPFLGRLPDTVIAECADVSPGTVRKLRRKLGVPRYTLRAMLAEADK